MSTKNTKPVYSGSASKKFWARINALPGLRGEYLYAMGCRLQDMERTLLDKLDNAEIAVKKNRVKKRS